MFKGNGIELHQCRLVLEFECRDCNVSISSSQLVLGELFGFRNTSCWEILLVDQHWPHGSHALILKLNVAIIKLITMLLVINNSNSMRTAGTTQDAEKIIDCESKENGYHRHLYVEK